MAAHPIKIDPQAVELLSRYDYPGNVRELENAIERACALCEDNMIMSSDLPPQIVEFANEATARKSRAMMPVGKSLDEFIQEQEREYIEATLAKFKGSREKAASVLGISMATLSPRPSRLGNGGFDREGRCVVGTPGTSSVPFPTPSSTRKVQAQTYWDWYRPRTDVPTERRGVTLRTQLHVPPSHGACGRLFSWAGCRPRSARRLTRLRAHAGEQRKSFGVSGTRTPFSFV